LYFLSKFKEYLDEFKEYSDDTYNNYLWKFPYIQHFCSKFCQSFGNSWPCSEHWENFVFVSQDLLTLDDETYSCPWQKKHVIKSPPILILKGGFRPKKILALPLLISIHVLCLLLPTVCVPLDVFGLTEKEDIVICRTLVHIVSWSTKKDINNFRRKQFKQINQTHCYKSHFYSHI